MFFILIYIRIHTTSSDQQVSFETMYQWAMIKGLTWSVPAILRILMDSSWKTTTAGKRLLYAQALPS